MGSTGSSTNRKTLIWIGGGCLALAMCTVAIILFGFGGIYWFGSQTAPEVSVDWEVPTAMQVGERFEFRFKVTNISNLPVDVMEIDFSSAYLSSVLIESTIPQYIDTFQYAPLGGGEQFQTFTFQDSIPPDKTHTYVFNGTVVLSGDFTGNILICINSVYNCRAHVVRTIVQ